MKKLIFAGFIFFINLSAFSQNTELKVLNKRVIKALKINKSELNLFYFLEPSCPISQKYQSIIQKLNLTFDSLGIKSTFIYPNSFSKNDEINQFSKEIDFKAAVLLDFNKYFTRKIGAKITPEVFLINKKGQIKYKGAIDDWYYQLGKNRKQITNHYLINAVNNYFANSEINPKITEAIGCDIE
jgi:hypothetical protein